MVNFMVNVEDDEQWQGAARPGRARKTSTTMSGVLEKVNSRSLSKEENRDGFQRMKWRRRRLQVETVGGRRAKESAHWRASTALIGKDGTPSVAGS
jgi:hypothetical protein